MTSPRPLIIGSGDDPHVRAVVDALGRGAPYIVDACSLTQSSYLISEEGLEFGDGGALFRPGCGTRGWIRRLAPAGWGRGTVLGSRTAAAQASAVSLLAAACRLPSVEWLTPIDPLLIAESKVGQITAALRLGIATPATVITNRRDRAQQALGDRVVIKPLGPGHFQTDAGTAAVVYATAVDLSDPQFDDLGDTPFLIQKLLVTKEHLRVVTVKDQVFVAALPAADYPLDWRADAAAHRSFRALGKPPVEVADGAVALANALGLGSSSQDWVITAEGAYMLDINPGGQWLFLPATLAASITAAIAAWLQRGDRV